jgi:hypothetical protein
MTIYEITGGFQAARQAVQLGNPVEIKTEENSDLPKKSKCYGVHSYTIAWDVDLDDLKNEAIKWTKGYGKIAFQVV